MKYLLLRFLSARSGNVALSISLLLVPMLLAVGAAVDYTSLNRARSAMQNAADSAALAAAAADEELSKAELRKLVRKYFVANGGKVEVSRRTKVGSKTRTAFVEVRAFSRVNSVVMNAFGRRFTDVRVTARANRIRSGLELALVVDTTQSMSYGMSWPETATAIGDLLGQFKKETARGSFYATLIPFNDRVNIGTGRKHWLRETDALDGWEGCVEPQETSVSGYPHALELQDPGKVFLPTVSKYWSGIYLHRNERDCATAITGPTNRINRIKRAFEKLAPMEHSTGRYDVALAWGWRSIAPQWAGHWDQGSSYPSFGNNARQKAIAFFTDGHTDINKFEFEEAKGEFGNNNGSKTSFEHFVRLCEQIKSEGIEVFVFHVLGNVHAAPYFKQCANENYFGVETGAEFVEALDELGKTGELIKLVR